MEGQENIDPDLVDFRPSKRACNDSKKLSKRFKAASDEKEVENLTKGYVPQNTKKSTAWAIKVFNEWRCSRDQESPPCDLLTIGDVQKLNYWIPRFVNEARRSDGCPYPPRTVNQLLAGLQRFMLSENHLLPKFMDRQNAVLSLFITRATLFVTVFTRVVLVTSFATQASSLKMRSPSSGIVIS